MDYLYYILAVLLTGMACISLIRRSYLRQTEQKRDIRTVEQRRRAPFSRLDERPIRGSRKPVSPDAALKRQMRQVPIPWGWPNYKASNPQAGENAGISSAMLSLTDRLVREKTLVNGQSVNPRHYDSMRTMLGDRYARTKRNEMKSVKYAKVHRPLLRDPMEEYDQTDIFSDRQAQRVRSGLKRVQGKKSRSNTSQGKDKPGAYSIKNIKQPWGW